MMEYLSGASSTVPTSTYQVNQQGFSYGTWAMPLINSIVKGETLDFPERQMPVIFLLAPKSDESFPMTGYKFVDYDLSLYVAAILPGQSAAPDGGANAIYTFYEFLDDLAARIRANPTLVSPSYPSGALVKWGLRFSMQEDHQRLENTVLIGAKVVIAATEMVNPNITT